MTVIEAGDLARAHDDEQLPESGIVLEATREEIQAVAGNLLLRQVVLQPCEGGIGEEAAQAAAQAASRLGERVRLCGDNDFTAVIAEVSLRLGTPPTYKLEWRDGRDFNSKWMTQNEIDAYEKALEEK